MSRVAEITRKTKETDVYVKIDIDGSGKFDIDTGIGFFDHMLSGFARHGYFDLTIKATGDLNVDPHHTVEDVGIVIGSAFNEALGDKKGITRFGDCILPMDDALVLTAVDLSGRHYFDMDLPIDAFSVGEFDTQLVHEFFYSFADTAKINLHIRKLSGNNAHHIIEATFKSVAKSLDKATLLDPRNTGILSTKGIL